MTLTSTPRRDSAPSELVWEPATVPRRLKPDGVDVYGEQQQPVDLSKLFYWLDLTGAPDQAAAGRDAPGGRIEAAADKRAHSLTVTSSGSYLRILLDERVADFGAPLQVHVLAPPPDGADVSGSGPQHFLVPRIRPRPAVVARTLAQVGQLQPFITVFPPECMANLYLLGRPNTFLAASAATRRWPSRTS
jgi:hypothetical protein